MLATGGHKNNQFRPNQQARTTGGCIYNMLATGGHKNNQFWPNQQARTTGGTYNTSRKPPGGGEKQAKRLKIK